MLVQSSGGQLGDPGRGFIVLSLQRQIKETSANFSKHETSALFLFHRIFTAAVRENLIIEGPGNGIIGDLVAINMQRGRDHGIPGYVKFVLACGGPFITSFTDPNLLTLMSQVQIDRLASVYETVVDVDIFAGAISESPVLGSQFGFTFTCILLEQFNNSRAADRFWYETNDHLVGFNIDQLDAIRNVTMSRIICDNADDVVRIQPKAFRPRNNIDNVIILCDDIATVDLTPFKGEGKMLFYFYYHPHYLHHHHVIFFLHFTVPLAVN